MNDKTLRRPVRKSFKHDWALHHVTLAPPLVD